MPTTYIISQIFVLAFYAVFACSFFAKSHYKILIFQIIQLLLLSGSFFFLSAWTGLALNAVSLVRSLVYMYLAKKNPSGKPNKLDITALVILMVISVATSVLISVLTHEGLYSYLALVECILFTYSTWQKSVKVYRFLGIAISITDILYSYFLSSWVAVALQGVVLIINVSNIIRIYGLKSKQEDDNSLSGNQSENLEIEEK